MVTHKRSISQATCQGTIDEIIQSLRLWNPLLLYGTYYPRGLPIWATPPPPQYLPHIIFYIGGDPHGSHVELLSWHY